MKPSAGNAPPRRLASPRPPARLDLRRRAAAPEPDDELGTKQTSPFWKWVGLIALFHLLLLGFVAIFYQAPPPTPPKEEFFTLVPPGHQTKGKPGPQTAPKVSPAQAAPSHTEPTPPTPEVPPTKVVTPPPPVAVQPPPPEPTPPPKPVVQPETPTPVVAKTPPIKPPPVKPPPKPRPKVALSKADLTEVDTVTKTAPTPAKPTPAAKPKPAPKKPSKSSDRKTPDTDTSNPDAVGLSKTDVASRLAHDLQTSGVENAPASGPNGAEHSKASDFADFYLSVRDQVMNKWQHPNLDDSTAINPEVTIYVEKDGRVPPERVRLTRSSGNQSFDDSALAAAKSLGYLLQPLPDGCPPDIHIDFKLTR